MVSVSEKSKNLSYNECMCVACSSVGVPVCVIHGTCTSQLYQILQISALTAGPIIGGTIVWLKSFVKHETNK